MRDIPIFTSEFGVASLTLREIPLRGEAYVFVRGVFRTLPELLAHCAQFCRAAGANRVYFGGEADFSAYPRYAQLIRRSIARKNLPPAPKALRVQAVTQDTAPLWEQLYNRSMLAVPAAQSCTPVETQSLAAAQEAFFVRENDEIVGLGRVRGNQLLALASLRKGSGAQVLCALARQMACEEITLLCAAENERAMHLYDRLGFSRGESTACWYGEIS
ncbi:MAG: GNAT family N-acetyltransferase [Oscillospiraceae bacterium]|jgi:hypothetical protein|nr:GNAT family N-acetyltransferase [Oscillospiraceae bacterium]